MMNGMNNISLYRPILDKVFIISTFIEMIISVIFNYYDISSFFVGIYMEYTSDILVNLLRFYGYHLPPYSLNIVILCRFLGSNIYRYICYITNLYQYNKIHTYIQLP